MTRHHRTSTTGSRARHGRRGERGATLVELAFVSVLLITLIAGTFDYGFAWRMGLAANEGARAGARVGSGQALSAGADYYALSSLRASIQSAGQIDAVQRVVIFKSTSSGGRVPTSCLATSASGTCNVMTGAQLKAMTTSSFSMVISASPGVKPTGTGCINAAAAKYVGWCPNARSNNQDTGSDFYGIYVEMRYVNKFPLLGSGTTVTRTAVMRLEPTGFGS